MRIASLAEGQERRDHWDAIHGGVSRGTFVTFLGCRGVRASAICATLAPRNQSVWLSELFMVAKVQRADFQSFTNGNP
jgi:hypothetical protein